MPVPDGLLPCGLERTGGILLGEFQVVYQCRKDFSLALCVVGPVVLQLRQNPVGPVARQRFIGAGGVLEMHQFARPPGLAFAEQVVGTHQALFLNGLT